MISIASSGILEPVRAPEGMTTKGQAVHTEYGDRVGRQWAQEHEGIIRDWQSFDQFRWPTVDDFDLSKWDAFDKMELRPGELRQSGLIAQDFGQSQAAPRTPLESPCRLRTIGASASLPNT